MDKLFQNRNDEAVHGRTWGMAEAQNQGDSHKTVEKTGNYLQESDLFKQEA